MSSIDATDNTDIPKAEPAARHSAARVPGSSRPVLEAVRSRRSHSKLTNDAPTHEELEEIISAMNAIADHKSIRPWRVIELRGKSRKKLGKALAKASGGKAEKYIAKAERAPLLLGIVVSPRKGKLPHWEQEAVASGVAHTLGLLLSEAGWGTIWRTGDDTRSKPVRKAMQLAKGEAMLGWIYVGGIPDRDLKPKRRKPIDLARHLTTL